MKRSVQIYPERESLYRACAARIAALATEAVTAHGAFHVALAGGATPAGLYREMAQPDLAARIDWARTHLYFGDERCVPPDHPESNFRMVRESLLSALPPGIAVACHPIPCDRAPADAATAYSEFLLRTVPLAENGLPRFDLVLLGLGTDGHVASLFPGGEALGSEGPSAAVHSPRPGAWRITLTLDTLNTARHLMLLVAGPQKAEIVRRALEEPAGATPLPVQRLADEGKTEWFIDGAAARLLPKARQR